MKIYKLLGLVLDKKDLTNGDREILFFDKEKGKISLLIKGIGKSKNRETYSTDMLVFSEFISYKNGVISNLTLLDPLRELKKDNFKLKSSLYIANILKEIIPFNYGKEIYPLVAKIFFFLKKANTKLEILAIVLIFLSSLSRKEGIPFLEDKEDFELVLKNGIIFQNDFKKSNFKMTDLLEILKNFDYQKIINYRLNLKEVLSLLELLELHVNRFLNSNINFRNFMKGFADERY